MSNHNAAERPPNIVVLISHDLGCHIGPYGFVAERTPALNQFASESLRLDRFFVSSPGCSQSRSSFVTGRYPHANGQFGLANWGWKLNEDEQLLPEVLRNRGYHTTLFGIWHLHEWTLGAFDTISADVSTLDSSPEGYAEIASDRAADWLQQRGPDEKPFYLHVGFWEVHRPFREPSPADSATEEVELEQTVLPDYLPDNEATRREFVKLSRSIMAVDNGVARVLKALEDSGLAENTLVLFTADHGLPFQRAKGTVYDPGIQVACLARWPGQIAPGSCSDSLVSNVDVMPTLLDVAGARIPAAVQGKSQLGLLRGAQQNGSLSNAIYAEKTYHEHYDPIRCLRTDRYKYIRNFAERPKLVLPSDIYNSPSRQAN
ncbi:MAG: sulfatase family protein, partial [Bythopirellula sp.]